MDQSSESILIWSAHVPSLSARARFLPNSALQLEKSRLFVIGEPTGGPGPLGPPRHDVLNTVFQGTKIEPVFNRERRVESQNGFAVRAPEGELSFQARFG